MKRMKSTAALFAVCLAGSALFAAFAPASALFGKKQASPAGVAAFAKSERPGQLIFFTREDFSERVSGEEALSGIVVDALPESGTLCLAGEALPAGSAVPAERLGALCFVPEIGQETHTCFTFRPIFSESGAGETAVTVSLNLSEEENHPPVAVALSCETYADLPLAAALRAVDPEGDPCTFEIVAQGKRGTARTNADGFVYAPQGRAGRDSFTYVATDCYGNRSQPATVTVSVFKRAPRERFTYTDLSGHPAHYAAIRLREAGVFSGEIIGADAFFYPEKPVTRAEFLALAASVAQLPLPASAVSTGLADNDEIPAWAQSYVAAGLTGGIVRGISDGRGNRTFRGSQTISRGEAAVILDRALALPNDGRELPAEGEPMPDWARQSVVNTASVGILPVFADRSLRVSDTVTRADAALMLYRALCYREADPARG